MKYLPTIMLLAAMVWAQGEPSTPASPSIPVDQANAKKARTLIDQAIAALGGNAYLNIQDISTEGRSYSFHHGRPTSVGVLFWRFYKFPDKDRIEVTKKRDVVYLYNGNKGYEITYKGARPVDAKDLSDYSRRHHYALDVILRTWVNAPKVALFYEGSAIAADKPAEQVTILNAQNEGITLYFDSTTHLPLKKSFSWRDPTDKERNVEEEMYDNYRLVQGVMTPFRITGFYNGDMSSQRFLSSASYNQGVSDSLFEASTTIK